MEQESPRQRRRKRTKNKEKIKSKIRKYHGKEQYKVRADISQKIPEDKN